MRRLGWIFGILAYLLPFGYYAASLLSTRYWATGLSLTLIFLLSRRGRALLRTCRPPRLVTATISVALLVALVPLFLGIHLPFPTRPRIVAHDATAFPSADGLIPMGAYLAFDFRPSASPDTGIRDHNQAIFLAALHTDFRPDATGAVPLLDTPMIDFLELAALLQGKRSYQVKSTAASSYADLRSLVKWPGGLDTLTHSLTIAADSLADTTSQPVSPAYRGIAIYHIQRLPGQKPVLADEPWRYLRAIYGGNDFRIRPPAEALRAGGNIQLPLREGKTLAICAATPFRVVAAMRNGSVVTLVSEPLPAAPGIHAIVLDGRQSDAVTLGFDPSQAPPVSPVFAESVLPDYMSIRLLRGGE
jgi:hypothetical protein